MTERFYDYETESGIKMVDPRITFRNVSPLRSFKLVPKKIDNATPWDAYSDRETGALIYVVGRGEHVQVDDRYELTDPFAREGGVAFICEEKDREKLIKKLSKFY